MNGDVGAHRNHYAHPLEYQLRVCSQHQLVGPDSVGSEGCSQRVSCDGWRTI